MSFIKFNPSEKILIYRCDFDVNDHDDYKLVRENIKEEKADDELEFEKDNCVFKFHLTESVALNWAIDYNVDGHHRIYSDDKNYIFDVILYTYAIDLWEFNVAFFARSYSFFPKYSQLKVEHFIYQDVDGRAEKRILLSRNVIQDPFTTIQNNVSSENCTECKGRKKIYLFSSEIDCDKCI